MSPWEVVAAVRMADPALSTYEILAMRLDVAVLIVEGRTSVEQRAREAAQRQAKDNGQANDRGSAHAGSGGRTVQITSMDDLVGFLKQGSGTRAKG